MKVTIDRERKTAYIQDATPKWACWAGYYFAANHPSLTGWHVRALDAGEKAPSNASECHEIRYLTGSAGEIASFICNPPEPPHDCPDCKCLPECCR